MFSQTLHVMDGIPIRLGVVHGAVKSVQYTWVVMFGFRNIVLICSDLRPPCHIIHFDSRQLHTLIKSRLRGWHGCERMTIFDQTGGGFPRNLDFRECNV